MAQGSLGPIPSDWMLYAVGLLLVLLSLTFFLIPILGRSGCLSGVKVPWILLYTYNKGGFYFVTSPILLIISALTFLVFLVRR